MTCWCNTFIFHTVADVDLGVIVEPVCVDCGTPRPTVARPPEVARARARA